MQKFFSFFEFWGNGIVAIVAPLFMLAISSLYALPVLLIGEFFDISAIDSNQEYILCITALILGPYMVSRYLPK
ncbi:hypothetical protein V4U61_003369 [Vibrio parahaemolyticus]